MRSLNNSEMTMLLDGISTSLLLAHKVTQDDLINKPEITDAFLAVLTSMINLDSTVVDTKIKQHLTPDSLDTGRLIKRNNIELVLFNGGKAKPSLIVV